MASRPGRGAINSVAGRAREAEKSLAQAERLTESSADSALDPEGIRLGELAGLPLARRFERLEGV
jgi:hypothetical protein